MTTRVLDLTRRAWTSVHGNITVIGTWIEIEGRWRPAMVLMRTGDDYSPFLMPCVVTVDKAWIWSEEVGDGAQAARTAFGFLQALRLDSGDQRQMIRIASMIADHLGDLLSIPPRPADEPGAVIAEVLVTDQSTGKQTEVELHDDV